jgi:phenylpyruvate tautomerase PptA (4-oxalocrotonate tautomerase family)
MSGCKIVQICYNYCQKKQRKEREIMPFINSKVSVSMSQEKKDAIKAKLGQAITLVPGKSESWLMVGFEDSYDLYFQGNQDGPTAFVEVKVFGGASPDAFTKLTGEICDIYQEELGIPKNRIYVKYEAVENWGWNGSNF